MGVQTFPAVSGGSTARSKRLPFKSLNTSYSPTIRGASAWQSCVNDTAAHNYTIPAGALVGDVVMIGIVMSQGGAPQPAGFTVTGQSQTYQSAGGSSAYLWLGLRATRLTQAEVTAGVISFATTQAAQGAVAQLVVVALEPPASSFSIAPPQFGGQTSTGSTTNVASIATTALNNLGSLVCLWSCISPTSTAAYTTPTNAANALTTSYVSGSGYSGGIAWSEGDSHPNPPGVTMTFSNGSAAYGYILVAISYQSQQFSVPHHPNVAPQELISSTPWAATALELILIDTTTSTGNARSWTVDLYTGAAGSEVYLTSTTVFSNGGSGAGNWYPPALIEVPIPAGSRVSMRGAFTSETGTTNVASPNTTAALYIEGALLG